MNKTALFILTVASVHIYALDPFDVAANTKSIDSYTTYSCKTPDISKPMALADVINTALCNNPDTKGAWLNALYQAAQVGVEKAAYLPNLSLSLGENAQRTNAKNYANAYTSSFANSHDVSLSATYLLYDFGLREANVQNAQALLQAANDTQNYTVQNTFSSALQSYYQLFAAQASLEAYRQSETYLLQSLNAAIAKYKTGVATPADKLQAQTAYSQAVLNTTQASGTLKIAQGTLANVMGLRADTTIALMAPKTPLPDEAFTQNIKALMDEAKQKRPDLLAAEAQIKAAQASVKAAQASGMPSISLSSSLDYTNSSATDISKTGAIGVAVSIPLFTGFSTTYKTMAAEQQLRIKENDYAKLTQQISLDVYKAYQNLLTQTQTLKTSLDLVASASESRRVAFGRYKAGVGTFIDLLNAESTLATAQQQKINALYTWYIDKGLLAQAIGKLDFTQLPTQLDGK